MACPNGLAFSPDESLLYVADDSAKDGRHFHTVEPGASDGFRLDSDGNIWSSAADGVHCISPKGDLMGKILVPELVSNVCFGGRNKHQLFITATTSVYAVSLNREGIQTP